MSTRASTALAAASSAPGSRFACLPSDPCRAGRASDLDGLMQKVLARRDENWKKLQQYILDEDERVEVRGPSNLPVWGEKREYSWFIQDGYFIRSPIKADGVEVSGRRPAQVPRRRSSGA